MYAWDNFLNQMELDLGKETCDKWLRSLKVVRFDAANIYLNAQDTFQILWFEEHVRQKALKKLINNNNSLIRVHLSVSKDRLPPRPSKRITKKEEKKEAPLTYNFDTLDSSYTFDAFIDHEGTMLVVRLLKELLGFNKEQETFHPDLTKTPEFNPIYLWGPSGCGKSHLLMAVTHVLQQANIKAVYSSAETFTDHLVSAIRSGYMSQFRQVWRRADVLLIDDIDILAKKSATQEEFFHTFNTLHLAGKQIILTSSVHPQDLRHVEPRLVSRFEWGIVLGIKALEKNLYSKLLKEKAETLRFPLPQKIALFLLETFTSSPKSLLKALDALVLRLHLDHPNATNSLNNMTSQQLRKLLWDIIKEEEKSTITSEKIINAVAEQFGIRVEDILGKAQSRDCVAPRQLAMHICRKVLHMPYTKIGDQFGRDHSTVMSAVKHVDKAITSPNSDLLLSLNAVTKKIQQN